MLSLQPAPLKPCMIHFLLVAVFPSQPQLVKIEFYNNLSDVKLSWMKPNVTGKGALLYVIEIQKNGTGGWRKVLFTKELQASLTSPSLSDHVRVCATNNVDVNVASCTKSYGMS